MLFLVCLSNSRVSVVRLKRATVGLDNPKYDITGTPLH